MSEDAWGNALTSSPNEPVPDVFAPELYPAPAPVEPSAVQRSATGPSQATELVQLALSLYRMVRGDDSKIYAVAHALPGIAVPLRGDGSIRQQMSSLFYEVRGRVPSGSALTDMITTLEGEALKTEETTVHIRMARRGATLYVDMGAPDGHAVAISAAGWKIVKEAPVLFRRSKATLTMPEPAAGGTLEDLRRLVNVSESGFRLMIGWLVAACMPNIPHPILALTGQQGTAKTTAARTLLSLIDPSAASMQSQPRAEEDWAVSAFNGYGIGLDNVSRLQPWFQDALCRAVTGDAFVRRQRYSDDGISVLYFRRPIVLTSIDPGALQGDVADRLLLVELDPIDRSQRKTDAEVAESIERIRAKTLGALFGLVAQVLDVLPGVELADKPRMADFALVLAALDQVNGWRTLPDFLAATDEAAHNVIEGDSFATAVVDHATAQGTWEGTAGELLAELAGRKPPADWPKTPRAVAGKLKRLTPALVLVGIAIVELPRQGGRRPLRLVASGPNLCTICHTPMAAVLVDQGETTHAGCMPDLLYERPF